MIGESKLWCKTASDWQIVKIFDTKDTVIKRLAWLSIYKEDYPFNDFILSQHNPNRSVGE